MARKPHTLPDAVAERILDAALELAARGSWEAVRLHAVARHLDLTLADIHAHYREKEDIAEAWFDRADRALLADAAQPGYAALDTRGRLQRSILAWLDALAPQRRVTREMIVNKLEPGHLHVQIPALLRISRTVQWLREAAGREQTFLWRALEETATTAIFVTTFAQWLVDETPNSTRTRAFLDRKLKHAESLARCLHRGPPRSSRPASETNPSAPGH